MANTYTISSLVAKLTRKTFVIAGVVQIVAIFLMMSILAYRDASNRATFLAHANQNALGLMLATGDLFQLKSVVGSFRTSETPQIWLLDENRLDILSGYRKPRTVTDDTTSLLRWSNGDLFLRIEHPIVYNGTQYGYLILLNKIRITEWAILCFIVVSMALVFFFLQGRVLEKFSVRVGSAIFDLGNLFAHASSEHELNAYAHTRQSTPFIEVESMAVKIVELLGAILRSSELEKEKQKYQTIAKISSLVAHDLRYPVSVFDYASKATSWSDFESMKPELDRALFNVTTMIEGLRNADTEKLVRLKEDILDLEEVVSDLKLVMSNKGVLLRCEGNATRVHTMLDRQKLVRSFHNLIFNAMEANASEIVLRSNICDGKYLVQILDNGPGVPDHFISKLFVEGESLGKATGTGLGLNSVRAVAAAHGGDITYERLAGHTIFSIWLPPLSVDSSDGCLDVRIETSHATQSDPDGHEKPRVYVNLTDKEVESNLRSLLAARHLDLLSKGVDLRFGDVVCTDVEEVLNAALELRIATVPFQTTETADTLVISILNKVEAMLFALKRRRNES